MPTMTGRLSALCASDEQCSFLSVSDALLYALMQRDVPGMTRNAIPILVDEGVHAITIWHKWRLGAPRGTQERALHLAGQALRQGDHHGCAPRHAQQPDISIQRPLSLQRPRTQSSEGLCPTSVWQDKLFGEWRQWPKAYTCFISVCLGNPCN